MESSNPQPSPPSLEELSTRGATALLLPWILGTAAASNSSPREVAVFVHQPSRSITLVEGPTDIESLLREVQSKEGPSPASKASIESLPVVQITEPGQECAICLTEYEVNGEERVKEMPCRHKFHADCIDKWLGIHGSCPMCRFTVAPAEENKEGEERAGGWRIHVFFARGRRGSDSDTGTDMDTDPGTDRGGDGVDDDDDDDDDGNDEYLDDEEDMEMDNIN